MPRDELKNGRGRDWAVPYKNLVGELISEILHFCWLICPWSELMSEKCNFQCLEHGHRIHVWLSGELFSTTTYDLANELSNNLRAYSVAKTDGQNRPETDSPRIGPLTKNRSWMLTTLGGRLILIHLQCWELLPFLTIQRQRCIKILCPKDPEFYTPLALTCQKGGTSQYWRCIKSSLPLGCPGARDPRNSSVDEFPSWGIPRLRAPWAERTVMVSLSSEMLRFRDLGIQGWWASKGCSAIEPLSFRRKPTHWKLWSGSNLSRFLMWVLGHVQSRPTQEVASSTSTKSKNCNFCKLFCQVTIFTPAQHINFGHSHFQQIPPNHQNGDPKIHFPELPGQGFFFVISTETLNFPEFRGRPDFSTMGSPLSAFWGGMKLICWALLNKFDYISHCLQNYCGHVPLFPIVKKSITYNYITMFLESYFCCQVTNYNYMNYSPVNCLRNHVVDHGTHTQQTHSQMSLPLPLLAASSLQAWLVPCASRV